jgi:hypothetical protein
MQVYLIIHTERTPSVSSIVAEILKREMNEVPALVELKLSIVAQSYLVASMWLRVSSPQRYFNCVA